MPKELNKQPRQKLGVRPPPITKKPQTEESLREQSKTEVEERPYLDTEGGE
jgi:hypothetical protein